MNVVLSFGSYDEWDLNRKLKNVCKFEKYNALKDIRYYITHKDDEFKSSKTFLKIFRCVKY